MSDSRGTMPPGGLLEVLRDAGIATEEDLDRAERASVERGIPPADAVIALGLLSEDQLYLALGDHLGLEYVFPSAAGVDTDLLARFPLDSLRRHRALPLLSDGREVVLAFAEPPTAEQLEELAAIAERPVRCVLASRRRIEQALDRAGGTGRVEPGKAAALDPSGITCFYRHLTEACLGGCSELRFEPGPDELRIRRRDATGLTLRATEPAQLAVAIASRARMLAGLPADDAGAAQEAEVEATIAGRTVALSIAVVRTVHGEAVRIGIDAPLVVPTTLEGFGLDVRGLGGLRRALREGATVVVASRRRAARRAFLALLAAECNATGRIVAIVATPPLADAPSCLHFDADSARAAFALRPEVAILDDPSQGSALEEAWRASPPPRPLMIGLLAEGENEALTYLLSRGASPARLARDLGAVVSIAVVRSLCPSCSAPDEREVGLPGARVPVGCAECGSSGYAGDLAAAVVEPATPQVAAALASGQPPEPGDSIRRALLRLVAAGRVAAADAEAGRGA